MPAYHDLIDELLRHGTSTLCEASGLPAALDYNIRPVWPGAMVAGAAFPLRCAPGDNLAIHLAVAQAEPGDVLVVDAHCCIAGLVIDGGVRDLAALEKLNFSVFARGIAMRACIKLHAPSVGEPIVIADVAIARGDLIVADGDGVVAIPQAQVERTLAGARQRTDKEAAIMQRLRAGETTVQILRLKSGK